eukprot:m.18819 g.18819  ORF g.18819 m.18819 type:complete len:153 (+) comp6406_c0_seq1:120-578(+)
MAYLKRLEKEHSNFLKSPEKDVILVSPTTFSSKAPDLVWRVQLTGGNDTLFSGEVYTLRITFDSKYPFEAPEVVFEGNPPLHEHVYSNGHICMSLLYDDWSPSLTAQSISNSLLSMIGSATQKIRPLDDALYIARAPKSPKKTRWAFHDNKC